MKPPKCIVAADATYCDKYLICIMILIPTIHSLIPSLLPTIDTMHSPIYYTNIGLNQASMLAKTSWKLMNCNVGEN